MKVLKPFVRDGKQYLRGDAVPAELHKTEIAHYRRHGMVGEADGKAAASTTPAPRTRQAAPTERKPARPSETKPAGPTNPGTQGEVSVQVVDTSDASTSSETLAVGSAASAAVDPVKDSAAATQAASLPLGE